MADDERRPRRGATRARDDRFELNDPADAGNDAARDRPPGARQDVIEYKSDTVHDAELPRSHEEQPMRLLSEQDTDSLGERWLEIQRSFVDDPRNAVQDADRLVSDVMQRLTTEFMGARSKLEEQWQRGEEASTEDLRQALHRYRTFFRQLLTI